MRFVAWFLTGFVFFWGLGSILLPGRINRIYLWWASRKAWQMKLAGAAETIFGVFLLWWTYVSFEHIALKGILIFFGILLVLEGGGYFIIPDWTRRALREFGAEPKHMRGIGTILVVVSTILGIALAKI